tara:strand:- start:16 stop:1785 length:1770 start_codon:yes stop_codon:yes gene_type:complete
MAANYDVNRGGWGSYSADFEAIEAFKNKKEYTSGPNPKISGAKWKYRSDGKTLFLHDTPVARHHKDGIEVSNGGHDTPLGAETHNALGINSRPSKHQENGMAIVGGKELDKNSSEWVLVKHKDILKEPVRLLTPDNMRKTKKKINPKYPLTKKLTRKRSNAGQYDFKESAIIQEREQGDEKVGNPLSKINIQPTDQHIINDITKVNSPLGLKKRGTEAHHLLEYSGDGDVGRLLDLDKKKGDTRNNSIMIPSDAHKFISNFQKSSPATNLKRLRQMDSKIKQLKGKLQKIAAKGDIVPTKYYGGNPNTTIKMKTKEFLDKSSSSGMSESIGEDTPLKHNSGPISDLNRIHSGDPNQSDNRIRQRKKKYYIQKDKEGNYTKDMHKYYGNDVPNMIGVDEIDFIDENTKPTTIEGKKGRGYQGHDTTNKILGSGEDTYDGWGTNPDREIFRGDEAGSTEYFKRKLRRGGSIERPLLDIGVDNKITGHEGRHRSRALMEEGVEDVEVDINERTDDSSRSRNIRGQESSLDSLKEKLDRMKRLGINSPLKFRSRDQSDYVETQPRDLRDKLDKIKEDTRAPIFGRFSKLDKKD